MDWLLGAEVGTRLAGAGYAVYGMDYEGHGKSEGRRCYIRKFGNVVADCGRFFKSICGNISWSPPSHVFPLAMLCTARLKSKSCMTPDFIYLFIFNINPHPFLLTHYFF